MGEKLIKWVPLGLWVDIAVADSSDCWVLYFCGCLKLLIIKILKYTWTIQWYQRGGLSFVMSTRPWATHCVSVSRIQEVILGYTGLRRQHLLRRETQRAMIPWEDRAGEQAWACQGLTKQGPHLSAAGVIGFYLLLLLGSLPVVSELCRPHQITTH